MNIVTILNSIYQHVLPYAQAFDVHAAGLGPWSIVLAFYCVVVPMVFIYNMYHVPQDIRDLYDFQRKNPFTVWYSIFVRTIMCTFGWTLIAIGHVFGWLSVLIVKFSMRNSSADKK